MGQLRRRRQPGEATSTLGYVTAPEVDRDGSGGAALLVPSWHRRSWRSGRNGTLSSRSDPRLRRLDAVRSGRHRCCALEAAACTQSDVGLGVERCLERRVSHRAVRRQQAHLAGEPRSTARHPRRDVLSKRRHLARLAALADERLSVPSPRIERAGVVINADHFPHVGNPVRAAARDSLEPWEAWWRSALADADLSPLAALRQGSPDGASGDEGSGSGDNGLTADEHIDLLTSAGVKGARVVWQRGRSCIILASRA
jgi:hypothetical protein